MFLFPCSYVTNKEMTAINPGRKGTKVAAYYVLNVPAGEERQVYLRLTDEKSQPTGDPFGLKFQEVFQSRIEEADDFYNKIMPTGLGPKQQLVSRQAYAGKEKNIYFGIQSYGIQRIPFILINKKTLNTCIYTPAIFRVVNHVEFFIYQQHNFTNNSWCTCYMMLFNGYSIRLCIPLLLYSSYVKSIHNDIHHHTTHAQACCGQNSSTTTM